MSLPRTPVHTVAALYLFGGGGKSYRPNITSVSAAGEALAGYCLERFGFTALARPLGVMPDIVLSAEKGGQTYMPWSRQRRLYRRMLSACWRKSVSKFLSDIKTRANGFRSRYEGYLICSRFEDGGKVDCACLHVDLKHHCRAAVAAPIRVSVAPAPLDRPAERLQDFIRLQAETVSAGDEYLAALFSEEATRAATFALMKEGKAPRDAADVDRRIWTVAEELGLSEQWRQGQDLIKHSKSREREEVEQAIELYHKPAKD